MGKPSYEELVEVLRDAAAAMAGVARAMIDHNMMPRTAVVLRAQAERARALLSRTKDNPNG